MTLGYVTASFPFGIGETFLIPEIRGLASRGIQVRIWPLYPRGDRRSDWNAPDRVSIISAPLLSVRMLAASAWALLRHPLRASRLTWRIMRGPVRLVARNLAVLPKGLWLANELERSACDHLHVHWGGTTATAGMIAAEVAGIPWSLTCHRWDIYENNLLRKKVGSAIFTRFISERGRADAVARGVDARRTMVSPLGSELPESAESPTWPGNGEFRLLCPALLLPVKGHRFLLDAVARLVRAGLDIRLLLAGEGPLRSELEQEVARLALGERVAFLGQIAHSAVLRMYSERRVHAVVLPSVDLGGGEHEGVPVSLMEAMGFGIPVVSTKTGSIPELLPDRLGLTVPDKNGPALASLLERLIRDSRFYGQAAIACRERVRERWDIDACVERLVQSMDPARPER
ncbi:glycosyltransferase [Anaeromyxobacter sp. SG66]|uniref:glycosyltransferase n=1 Tax=Anaeromyxobacter sp. SG66 TaxID=2925410 RepID=UPI001F57281A|nr:glycosyltransferase [Anaeromyxobacter sp. SG66]